MKPLLVLAASAAALTAAACAPQVPPARAALDCPAKQGDLTRTSAAPDGKTCAYVSSDGAEVTLELVSTQGGVDGALSGIETRLLANRTAPADAGKAADGKPAPAASTESAAAAEQAAREAAQDAAGIDTDKSDGSKSDSGKSDSGKSSGSRNVDVSAGGAVVTEGDGTTRVNLPGIHIVANENDDTAKVKVGPISVDANSDTATVRMRREVRLKGEAFNPEKRGVRAMFIYTGKDLPDGYRFVGYEAGGPKRGPITVAIVRSKADDTNRDELYPDVKKLVRDNGGV